MLEDLQRAKIVITNYHALRLREGLEVSSGGRALLQGPGQPLETEGQMVQRVMPELMGIKNVMALNDEGHHCYRLKPGEDDERPLTAEAKQEAAKNSEEARVWISGLEIVKHKLVSGRWWTYQLLPFSSAALVTPRELFSPGP